MKKNYKILITIFLLVFIALLTGCKSETQTIKTEEDFYEHFSINNVLRWESIGGRLIFEIKSNDAYDYIDASFTVHYTVTTTSSSDPDYKKSEDESMKFEINNPNDIIHVIYENEYSSEYSGGKDFAEPGIRLSNSEMSNKSVSVKVSEIEIDHFKYRIYNESISEKLQRATSTKKFKDSVEELLEAYQEIVFVSTLIGIFILNPIFGIACAIIAGYKKRNKFWWFVFGYFINVAPVIIISLLKKKEK